MTTYRRARGKKVTRRGRGNPANSDRFYDAVELEWLKAIDHWRRANGGKTPDCRAVLAVAKELGYAKEVKA